MAVPLATVDDLAARLGRILTETEATRAVPLLADASGLVRAYARQQFDLVTGDQVLRRPVGSELRLPQRPVLAVTTVVAVGCAGQADVTLSSTDWCWDGSDQIEVGVVHYQADNPWWQHWWSHGGGPDTYRVTYNHGYATIPDDVVAVVCGMVNRVLTAPTDAEGLTAERIGQYGYQYGQIPGGQSPGPSVRLTQADKQALIDAGYKRRSATVQLRT